MDFQKAKVDYLNYLTEYIEVSIYFWQDLHRLQTYSYSVMAQTKITNPEIVNEWEPFKNELQKIYYSSGKFVKSDLYRLLKYEFYPVIEKYELFFKDNICNINKFYKGDKNYIGSKNPYINIGWSWNEQSNPFTILSYLCAETRKEIELLYEKQTLLGYLKSDTGWGNLWRIINFFLGLGSGLIIAWITHLFSQCPSH